MKKNNLKKRIHIGSKSLMLVCSLLPILTATTQVLAQEQRSDSSEETIMRSSTQDANKSDIEKEKNGTSDEQNHDNNENNIVPPLVDSQTTSTISESTTKNESLATPQEKTAVATPKSDNNIITIPDTNLKQAILKNLGLTADTQLTQADMNRLTILSLSSVDLQSIEGLEYAVNLSTLSISGNTSLTDFSPLEHLSSLTSVTLQTNSITSENFPNLEANKGLTNLSLANTNIDNNILSKIAKFTSLVYLNMDQNTRITTIEPLKTLPNLNTLFVQFCGITDFTVIPHFPSLTNLSAFGQNTGRTDSATTIPQSSLNYDETNQTIYIPFSLMPNRMTNFDGYVPPFSTSNSQSNTYFDLNGIQLPSNRLQINDQGITVTSVTSEEYKNIKSFKYNARLNNPFGSYAIPEGFKFYAISSGTYLHQFEVAEDGEPITIHYQDQNGVSLSPEETLNGYVGLTYETKAIDIEGYTLKEVHGNGSGKFTDQPQTVTYIYSKNLVKGADVTTRYVDIDGNEISNASIISGNLNDTYTTSPIDIKGYTLKEGQGNRTGVFTEQPQTIDYIYDKMIDPVLEEKTPKNMLLPSSNQDSLPQTGEMNETTLKNLVMGLSLLILTSYVLFLRYIKYKK